MSDGEVCESCASLRRTISQLSKKVQDAEESIKHLHGEIAARDTLVAYMNNKERMARDNAELHRLLRRLKARFADVFGHLENALRQSFETSTDDLHSFTLPEPLPALLQNRYLN